MGGQVLPLDGNQDGEPENPHVFHEPLSPPPSRIHSRGSVRGGHNHMDRGIVDRSSPAQSIQELNEKDHDEVLKDKIFVEIEKEQQIKSIVPNYEGFKAHVRYLNPQMDSRNSWLVSRIAHQQEIRYTSLLNQKVEHSRAVLQGNCVSGSQCITLGETSIIYDSEGNLRPPEQREPPNLQLATDLLDSDSNQELGTIPDETFPTGIPLPPVRTFPAEFECQLCFNTKKYQKPSDWTKHVHEDVQPFTCTYFKCVDSKLFKRKADWVRHENERHRHLEWWICQVDDCKHISYIKKNFLQHLVREHKLPEPKQETKVTMKQARLTEPAWILLKQCSHETQKRPQDESCKFCSKSFPTWKKLTVHLAKHMEHISLPILRLVESNIIDTNTSGGDQDWDLRSLVSLNSYRDSALGSSLPSNVSASIGKEIPRTAQEEVLFILNSDLGLRALFEEAAARINKQRFVRNVRRLFLMYHKDLQEHAVDPRENDATSIVKTHAEWLSNRLFDICDPNSGSNNQVMAAHLNQQTDKRALLEKYLASVASQSNISSVASLPESSRKDSIETPRIFKQQDADTDSEQGDYSERGEVDAQYIKTIDYSNFPNLEHIKDFMTSGTAFKNLSQSKNTQENAQPTDLMSTSTLTESTGIISQDPYNAVQQNSTSPTAATDVTISYAESETGSDLSELSLDPELYDETPENRILSPKSYFERLRSLERELFYGSGILAFKHGISTSSADDNFLLQGFGTKFVFNVSVNTEAIIHLIKVTRSEKLLLLLESYNLATWMGTSLTKLQDNGYCTGHISLVVKDQDRAEVAKIVQIETQAIISLGSAFEGLLHAVMATLSTIQIFQIDGETVKSIIDGHDSQRGLTMQCMEMLNRMGLSPYLLLNDIHPMVWECVTQSLELGILSYAGAHLQRFDLEYLAKDIDSFQLPRRFIYYDQVLKEISSRQIQSKIIFRRRELQCLDRFLGGIHPWVFHQDFANDGNHRLCLSTSISGLTDLWGPSWKIIRDSKPGCIQQLDIGNGAIVPWSVNTNPSEKKMEIRSFEIFCHWISFKEWYKEDIDMRQLPLSRKFFLESDILLIGASSAFGLVINQECAISVERLVSVKTKLNQEGALRSPKTSRPQRYIDSHAVQVQGTAIGILSAAGIVTYKRRNGQSMKDALIERWTHGLYNPIDLEAYSGVEISLCTRNARRRRLLHLLGSTTMHNYLHGINFKWISRDCKYFYFKALRSPKHFRQFWKGHLEYRENVGSAISKCLEALEETGIDQDSRELRGLWIESFDSEGDSDGESDGREVSSGEEQASPPAHSTITAKESLKFFEEWIITLFRSEHTWTGFLEDSEESFAMVVLDKACLDFDHEGYGRRCSQLQKAASNSRGYPVLQTSLQVNNSILNGTRLKCEVVENRNTKFWNAKELKKGTVFCLGDHGALKVLTPASQTCPAIMEWNGVKSETFNEVKNVAINEKLLGRNKEKHHREHIRGKWETKPLPILVLSKSTKVMFSKEKDR